MNEEDEAFEDLAKRQGDWGMQGSRKHQIMRYAENVESKGTSMTDKDAMKLALDALETLMIERGSIYEKAIAALKERLEQPHETTLKEFNQLIHDDPKYHIWAKEKEALADPMREVQRLGQEIEQERNFCPRCGKRTKDLTHIHTCTPPKD
jgi:NADH pyrophosphatase NudC (nudix superfamily)